MESGVVIWTECEAKGKGNGAALEHSDPTV